MSPPLDPSFVKMPLAHRALHDVAAGRPENSRAAVQAAIDAGYGIEIDVQRSTADRAMVFHDYDLKRLTGQSGPIQQRKSEELALVELTGGSEGVPTLREVLALVDGRVPLLVEIKDQDGALGPNVGPLERSVAEDVSGYVGPLAVMSFNPESVRAFAAHAPDVTRGLTTGAFRFVNWGLVPKARRAALREIPDFDDLGCAFISHDTRDLGRARVAELKTQGVPILCWTTRSETEERAARVVADNVTFEGYAAARPDS